MKKSSDISDFIGVHLICVKYSLEKTDKYLISNFLFSNYLVLSSLGFILNVD